MNQLPNSIDVEQALIGSMLYYPKTVNTAYEENLKPSDFFNEPNKIIYQAICDLRDEGVLVDLTSVLTRLTDTNKIKIVGGTNYLAQLADMAVSESNCKYYIDTVQNKAVLRKLIEVSNNVAQNAVDNQANPMDVLNEAEKAILEVTRNRKTSDFITSKETFEGVFKNLQYLVDSKGVTGVETGYTRLDHITNGFQKGDLIIIAARPSVGKTAFALNIAANCATQYNNKVALFSLEMPAIQLGMRMLAAKSGVDSYKIRTGRGLTNTEWGQLEHAKTILQKSALFIDESSSIKVPDIVAKCRKLQSDQGLDIVIIDYLQLVKASGDYGGNRVNEVSEISRSLKSLARELNVPVIALAQLSRGVEARNAGADSKPRLSDLRESGAIEQDADIVIAVHDPDRRKNEERDFSDPRNYEMLILKHRNGAIGEFKLTFQPDTNAFINLIEE